MKLLIMTQKVDANDDVLGFFHGWIKEFAKHCEEMTVIALGVLEYDLPKNVRVLSLGKEEGVSRLSYLINFYRLIWRERKNYDTVFVHMNQEYILLGGLIWKCLGKKIALWRNHYAGSLLTRIAMMISDKIFCTSKYSFTARSKKMTLMPVGVDTDLFKKEDRIVRKPHSVLFLARISPSKKPHLIIEALRKVRDKGIDFTADFYGNPLPQDVPYLNSLKEKVKAYSLEDRVTFEKGVPNRETPRVYGAHTIFINASPSGMYDKTIFEAMACESLVLTSNINLKGSIDDMFLFREDDEEDLAKQLAHLLALSFEEKEELGKRFRVFVVSQHSLILLGDKLIKCLTI